MTQHFHFLYPIIHSHLVIQIPLVCVYVCVHVCVFPVQKSSMSAQKSDEPVDKKIDVKKSFANDDKWTPDTLREHVRELSLLPEKYRIDIETGKIEMQGANYVLSLPIKGTQDDCIRLTTRPEKGGRAQSAVRHNQAWMPATSLSGVAGPGNLSSAFQLAMIFYTQRRDLNLVKLVTCTPSPTSSLYPFKGLRKLDRKDLDYAAQLPEILVTARTAPYDTTMVNSFETKDPIAEFSPYFQLDNRIFMVEVGGGGGGSSGENKEFHIEMLTQDYATLSSDMQVAAIAFATLFHTTVTKKKVTVNAIYGSLIDTQLNADQDNPTVTIVQMIFNERPFWCMSNGQGRFAVNSVEDQHDLKCSENELEKLYLAARKAIQEIDMSKATVIKPTVPKNN